MKTSALAHSHIAQANALKQMETLSPSCWHSKGREVPSCGGQGWFSKCCVVDSRDGGTPQYKPKYIILLVMGTSQKGFWESLDLLR